MIAVLLLLGCRASVPIEKDAAFAAAVQATQKDRHTRAASAAWAFIAAADPDDPRYDRALRLLGQSSEELGLTYIAGLMYRDVAQSRRNMDLYMDAIRGIKRIVETGVYDRDLLVDGFVAAEEFGYLDEDLQPFVDYHRGLDLARRGDTRWWRQHFGNLPEDDPYYVRAVYALAVQQVARRDFRTAVTQLTALRDRDDLPDGLADQIEHSLARLAFEEQRFEDALKHYETLRDRAPDDPELILEMAWTQYYLGDSRKTLGLLIALEAPVHADYVSPERFLLEALALRRLCQFGAAREAAVRLRDKHGKSLSRLRGGEDASTIEAIRAGARMRVASRSNSDFLDRLRIERAHVQALKLTPELQARLDTLYARGIAEAERREEARIDADVALLTEELLAAEEGVRLIVHELGVSLLRGRRRPVGVDEKPPDVVAATDERVVFDFRGEYWTDELDDLVVVAEDRCID